MKHTADRLFGDQYFWSVLAGGQHQMIFDTSAAMMGGNIGVGLEDLPYIGLGKLARCDRGLGCRTRLQGRSIPAWDARLFDLARAASSTAYCDDIHETFAGHGLILTELTTRLQGQLGEFIRPITSRSMHLPIL